MREEKMIDILNPSNPHTQMGRDGKYTKLTKCFFGGQV